ncbi:MAG: hypothetical protein CL833_13655 [Crocinitomicaceae bacterium]|nr:hypothetical protein [Crocinitomicaceae bacterium]|tara:strand:+ start:145 stop:876 length:732 start_codon:yes stop_codon:yes gene_type:complete
MKCVCIGHNTGLGDHIFMSGAVRYIAKEYDRTFILCLRKKLRHVEFLYRDDPTIVPKVMPGSRRCDQRHKSANTVYNKLKKKFDLEKVYGFQYNSARWRHWHKKKASFINMQYDAIGVPREERFNSFYIERDGEAEDALSKEVVPPWDYAFVCNKWSKGSINAYNLDIDLPLAVPCQKTNLIFDWMGVIEKAKEIYTVDTSFFHLIKSMKLPQKKFYVNSRRSIAIGEDYLNGEFDNNWEMIR